jgi:hypothetical protein
MPRTTEEKPLKKPRPKIEKPAATAADEQVHPEKERPSGKATGSVVGDLVSHPMFGDGTVAAVEADKLTIEFKDGRVKRIVDSYLKRRLR